MKHDEEHGNGDGVATIEFETDGDVNHGIDHLDGGGGSSSSSSSVSFTAEDRICGCEDVDEDGDQAGQSFPAGPWPASYRQSIDMFSSVVASPNLGFLASAKFRSSLLPGTSMLATPESSAVSQHLLAKPQQPEAATQSPGSLLRSAYADLPPLLQCTAAQATANGVNMMFGVGLLAVPYAVKEGGWLGMTVLLLFGLLSGYTGFLLQQCLESSQDLKTYPDIGNAAFGATGRLFISIVLYLELYASCVEYITLVSDSLSSMFPTAGVNVLGVALTANQLFAVVMAVAVLPTVWFKNLCLLSYLSAGGVVLSLLVVSCLLWNGVVDGVGFHLGGTALNLTNLPVALGLYGFCYSGHAVFPNIYSSLRNPTQFPLVLLICFGTCTVLYAGVAITGYSMFGEATRTQFTLNMPQQFVSSKIAIWTTVLTPFTKYALTMMPVALCLEELLPPRRQTYLAGLTIRTLLVISTLVVALGFPYFALVMSLLGSVFAMLVTLILPCVCFLAIKPKSATPVKILICTFIITVGSICACVGSYSSVSRMFSAKTGTRFITQSRYWRM